MAIVGGKDDEDPNAPQNGAPPAPSQGGSGFVGGGSGTGSTTKTAGAPTSSGGYTNLSNYLQANQGGGATNAQAGANVVNQAGTAANTAQSVYNTSAGNDIYKAGGDVNVNNDTLAAVKSGTKSAKDAQVSWNGPNTVDDLTGDAKAKQTDAVAANQNVYDLAGDKGAAGGQSGVASLLQKAYQQPSYTRGENNLDAFLAGGSPEGQKTLAGTADVAKNTAGGYDKINQTLNDQINTEKGWADSTNETYNNAPFQLAPSNTTSTGTPISMQQKQGGGQASQVTFDKRTPAPVQPTVIPHSNSAKVQFNSRTPSTPKPTIAADAQAATNNAVKAAAANPLVNPVAATQKTVDKGKQILSGDYPIFGGTFF